MSPTRKKGDATHRKGEHSSSGDAAGDEDDYEMDAPAIRNRKGKKVFAKPSQSKASAAADAGAGGDVKRKFHPDLSRHETYPPITNRDICKLAKLFHIDTKAWNHKMKISGSTFLATIKSQMKVALQPYIQASEELKFMYNLYGHFPSLPKPKNATSFELWLQYFVGWLSALNNVPNITPVLQTSSEVVVSTTRMDPRDVLAPFNDVLLGDKRSGSDGNNNVQILGVNIHDVYPTYRRWLHPTAVLVMLQLLCPGSKKIPILDEVLCRINKGVHTQVSPRTSPMLLAHKLNTLLHWFDVIDHDDTLQFIEELTTVMNARNIYLPCPFAVHGSQVLSNTASMVRFWSVKPFLGTFYQNPRDLSNLFVTDEFRLVTISTLIKSHALTSTFALNLLAQLTRVVLSEESMYTNEDVFSKAMNVIKTGNYPPGNLHPLGTGPMENAAAVTTMSVKKRYMALCLAECYVELQMRAFIRCARINVQAYPFLWHALFTKAPVHFESVVDSILSGNSDIADVPMRLIYDLDMQLKMGTSQVETRYAFAVNPGQSLEPAVVDPMRTIEMYVGILFSKGLLTIEQLEDLPNAYYNTLRGHLESPPETVVTWTPSFPAFFPGFRYDICPRYQKEMQELFDNNNAVDGGGGGGGDDKSIAKEIAENSGQLRFLIHHGKEVMALSPLEASQVVNALDDTHAQLRRDMATKDLSDLQTKIAILNGVAPKNRANYLERLVKTFTGVHISRVGSEGNRRRVSHLENSGSDWREDYKRMLEDRSLGGGTSELNDWDMDKELEAIKEPARVDKEVMRNIKGSDFNLLTVVRYDPARRRTFARQQQQQEAAMSALSAASSDAGTSRPGAVNLADPTSEPSLLSALRSVHSLVRRVMGMYDSGGPGGPIRPMDKPPISSVAGSFDTDYNENMYAVAIEEAIQEEYKRSVCRTLGDREDSIGDVLSRKESSSSRGGGVGAFVTDRDLRVLEEQRKLILEHEKFGTATRHQIMLLDTIRTYIFSKQSSTFKSGSVEQSQWAVRNTGQTNLEAELTHPGSRRYMTRTEYAGNKDARDMYLTIHDAKLDSVGVANRFARLGYAVRNGVHPTVVCVLRDIPVAVAFDKSRMAWLNGCTLSPVLIHADIAQAISAAHNVSIDNIIFMMAVMNMDVLSMYVSFLTWVETLKMSENSSQYFTSNRPLQMTHFFRYLMVSRGYRYEYVGAENPQIKQKFITFRTQLTKPYFDALNSQQSYALRLTRCVAQVPLERKWYVCKKLFEWINVNPRERGAVLKPTIDLTDADQWESLGTQLVRIFAPTESQRPVGWKYDVDFMFQVLMHVLFFDDACNITKGTQSALNDFFGGDGGGRDDTFRITNADIIKAIYGRRGSRNRRSDDDSGGGGGGGDVNDDDDDRGGESERVINPLFEYDEARRGYVLDESKLGYSPASPSGSEYADRAKERGTNMLEGVLNRLDGMRSEPYAEYLPELRRIEDNMNKLKNRVNVVLKDAAVIQAENLHPVSSSTLPKPIYVPWYLHYDTVMYVTQCAWRLTHITLEVKQKQGLEEQRIDVDPLPGAQEVYTIVNDTLWAPAPVEIDRNRQGGDDDAYDFADIIQYRPITERPDQSQEPPSSPHEQNEGEDRQSRMSEDSFWRDLEGFGNRRIGGAAGGSSIPPPPPPRPIPAQRRRFGTTAGAAGVRSHSQPSIPAGSSSADTSAVTSVDGAHDSFIVGAFFGKDIPPFGMPPYRQTPPRQNVIVPAVPAVMPDNTEPKRTMVAQHRLHSYHEFATVTIHNLRKMAFFEDSPFETWEDVYLGMEEFYNSVIQNADMHNAVWYFRVKDPNLHNSTVVVPSKLLLVLMVLEKSILIPYIDVPESQPNTINIYRSMVAQRNDDMKNIFRDLDPENDADLWARRKAAWNLVIKSFQEATNFIVRSATASFDREIFDKSMSACMLVQACTGIMFRDLAFIRNNNFIRVDDMDLKTIPVLFVEPYDGEMQDERMRELGYNARVSFNYRQIHKFWSMYKPMTFTPGPNYLVQ